MRKFKIVLLLIVAVILIVAVYYLTGSYSEGFRAGTVIKLSHKGVVFKTYEGQLNLGMVLSDEPAGAAVSNIWEFSVPASRTETVKDLENAMLNGKRIKLHYKEKFVTLPWRGDTRYMVFDVEEQ